MAFVKEWGGKVVEEAPGGEGGELEELRWKGEWGVMFGRGADEVPSTRLVHVRPTPRI